MITPRRAQRDVGRLPGGRRLLWCGVAAATLYVMVVTLLWPFPVRLLYDGLAPLPPYRWVHPPASRAADNEPALSGTGTLAFGPRGVEAAEIATDDDQALVTFPVASIETRAGESSVKVTITPLDPAAGVPTPPGCRVNGNAYRIDASYATSATAAVLSAPVTVVLRYPVHATQLLRSLDQGWSVLATVRFDGSQQVLANTERLGIFIAATGCPAKGSRRPPAWAPIAAGAVLITAMVGFPHTRRRVPRHPPRP